MERQRNGGNGEMKRQRDRDTGGGETERQRNRVGKRWREIEDGETEILRDGETEKQRNRETEIQRDIIRNKDSKKEQQKRKKDRNRKCGRQNQRFFFTFLFKPYKEK
jgi:hypothetical protein